VDLSGTRYVCGFNYANNWFSWLSQYTFKTIRIILDLYIYFRSFYALNCKL